MEQNREASVCECPKGDPGFLGMLRRAVVWVEMEGPFISLSTPMEFVHERGQIPGVYKSKFR